MKKFCISLTEHAADVINFEKKKMLPLTKKELKLHQEPWCTILKVSERVRANLEQPDAEVQ